MITKRETHLDDGFTYHLSHMTSDHAPVPELDGRRALRVVRSHMRPVVDDAHKVGIVGSSAGGHLAATVLAYNDNGDANASDPVEKMR